MRQRSANTFRAPPEISLPIVTPPWPSFIEQSRITDVLHRHVHAPPIVVAAGLQRDAVVAGVERAAFDQHVAARLGIAAVVVRPMAVDDDAATITLVDRTGWISHIGELRIGDAVDEHVAAAIRLDEVWPQVGALAEDPLGHGHPRGGRIRQPPARGGGAARPVPPVRGSACPSRVPLPVMAMSCCS
jgi:hypothetical protein